MTKEELAKMPLNYVYGMSGETGAIRVHQTEDGKIQRIVRTQKIDGRPGNGVVTYGIAGQKKEYPTVQSLLDALNELESK